MALSLFDFPYHTPQDEYPGGTTIKLGKGYRYAAKPSGPDEVITHLNFPAMFIYQLTPQTAPVTTVDLQLNIFALEDFYNTVKMYSFFLYNHHRYGQIQCRFNKPLVMPKPLKEQPGMVGGKVVNGTSYRLHQVEPFDMEILWTKN